MWNLFILLFLIRGRREEEEEEREKKKRNGFIFFNLIETIAGKSTHAEIFFLVKLFLEESETRVKKSIRMTLVEIVHYITRKF